MLLAVMFSDIGIGDWVMVLVRYAHGVAAIAWVGGSIFHALILRPLTSVEPEKMRTVMSIIAPAYREIIDFAVVTLIVSGLILMFSRIQGNEATVSWAIVLGIKIALALWMFYIVWRRRRMSPQETVNEGIASKLLGYNAILVLGLVVFLLANVLRELVEDIAEISGRHNDGSATKCSIEPSSRLQEIPQEATTEIATVVPITSQNIQSHQFRLQIGDVRLCRDVF